MGGKVGKDLRGKWSLRGGRGTRCYKGGKGEKILGRGEKSLGVKRSSGVKKKNRY